VAAAKICLEERVLERRLINKAGRPASQAGQQGRQANKAGRQANKAGSLTRQSGLPALLCACYHSLCLFS